MDNIIQFQQVTTPANNNNTDIKWDFAHPEISRYEIQPNFGHEVFYIRDTGSQCFEVETFEELWSHFCSPAGYRITFPLGNGLEMTMWKASESSPEQDRELFLRDVANGVYGVVVDRVDNEDGSVVITFDDGCVIEYR
jgi:hypothetical protein